MIRPKFNSHRHNTLTSGIVDHDQLRYKLPIPITRKASNSVAMSFLNQVLDHVPDIHFKIRDHNLERAKSQLQHIEISEKMPEQ